ncbi:pinin-like [Zingiber officinale]|uniref:pinin-like n=1 Tax=Zingiber officinale TaxID=94328 RepID=UPI001C4B082B|nr:pinin-like [Zingiber officinale]XP_042418676.1 pinin-like [Zingiber officinale]
MASSAAEKTADELRKEIQELHRRQREITERLRDPRGIRRGGLAQGSAAGPRNRGVVRPAVDAEDQPPQKRRLSSAIVKLEDGEIKEDAGAAEGGNTEDPLSRGGIAANMDRNDQNMSYPQSNVGGFRRDGGSRMRRMDIDMALPEPTPREPKLIQDASLIKRNKRMLGQLLGTLEKFREEDEKLSSTEAYMRRSDLLKRAEEKAREESEKLRQQEREQIAEKRKRDLTLRARVAAKAQEKKWELMFLSWSEHHKKLSNFLRTKAEPPIYYLPAKPLLDDPAAVEQQREQAFIKWKTARRAELSDYQKQIEEQFLSNVEKQLERWQNARNNRRADSLVNLQETMDKELETHQLEHGPKTRRIAGGNDDEEDVEDIAAEDELMDEVLGAHDQERIDADATKISDVDNGN